MVTVVNAMYFTTIKKKNLAGEKKRTSGVDKGEAQVLHYRSTLNRKMCLNYPPNITIDFMQ